MAFGDALHRAGLALAAYDQWRNDPNGGTTANEDRLAEALRAVIEERKKFEDALYDVRNTLDEGFGHRRTMSEGTAIREAQGKISSALDS